VVGVVEAGLKEATPLGLDPPANGGGLGPVPLFRFGQLALAPLTPDEAARWILSRAVLEQTSLVITSNISHLRLAETDHAFGAVVQRSDLNLADGWPLILAARLLGKVLPGRVAGIDLVESILTAGESLRLAILGGPPGAAELLARRFERVHRISLVDSLPKGTWDNGDGLESLKSAVDDARPNLILVGIGPPRQELLAAALRPVARGPIICCGATLEVLAGLRPRAPRYLQALGLEWAFRLALEPGRLWSRYLFSSVRFGRVLYREMRREARVAGWAPRSHGRTVGARPFTAAESRRRRLDQQLHEPVTTRTSIRA
jgi:N-acetylglucosaminyldiphosphoundecaprenol N-acetyl-beta-D-mannosaminyltransferase